MEYSKTVMRGLSDLEDAKRGLEDATPYLQKELGWYEEADRFPDNEAILLAADRGELELVGPDENVWPILRLRNWGLRELYPPFLLPRAAAMVRCLGKLWRLRANELGIHSDVRLSLTSMTRGQEYQDMIVETGILAIHDSTHLTGATVDFDMCGLTIVNFGDENDDERPAVVSLRKPSMQERIAKAFESDYKVKRDDPIRLGPEWFMPEASEALLWAANILVEHGFVNAVLEMPGKISSALHLSTAPDVTAMDFDTLYEKLSANKDFAKPEPVLDSMMAHTDCLSDLENLLGKLVVPEPVPAFESIVAGLELPESVHELERLMAR